MNRLLSVAVFVFVVFPALVVAATPIFPHYLNFQSILRDDAGNLVTGQFTDLEFRITDPQGNLLYDEVQAGVQVVRGAVNVMIGEGVVPGSNPQRPTGGIPADILDPSKGAVGLQVKIGNNPVGDPMEVGMVPYAVWSERALTVANDSIGSEQIKNGSIKVEDLDGGITFANIQGQVAATQVPASIATVEALKAHISSRAAHAASAITLDGPFSFSTATNLQDVIKDIDSNLLQEVANRALNRDGFKANDASLQNQLNQEATNRVAADTTLQTNIDTEAATRVSEDKRVLDSEVSRAGDTIFGDLVFFSDANLATETIRLAPATGDVTITTTGGISLLKDIASIKKDQKTGEAVLLMKDTKGAERMKVDAGNGTITLNGNLLLSGDVDGVDVSGLKTGFDAEVAERKAADQAEATARVEGDTTLQTNLTKHAGALTAHGSDGTVVGINTLNGSIAAHAALKTGVHGLTSPDPNNAIVGTTEPQTLKNKTLESPILETATLNNATLVFPKITGSDSGKATLQYGVSTKNRTFTIPDPGADDDIVTRTAAQELTNKILTSPTITGAVITGAKISGDGSGLTSLNGGNITSGTVAEARIDAAIARDSEYLAGDAALQGQIASEANTRSTSDASLSQTISAEGTARANADGSLSKSISDEVTARAGADSTLQGQMNSHMDGNNKSAHAFPNISGQIDAAQVPQYMRPGAFGSARFTCAADKSQNHHLASVDGIDSPYNASVVTGNSLLINLNNTIRFNFVTPIKAPYVVTASGSGTGNSLGSPKLVHLIKDDNGFDIMVGCDNQGTMVLDFIVFKN